LLVVDYYLVADAVSVAPVVVAPVVVDLETRDGIPHFAQQNSH